MLKPNQKVLVYIHDYPDPFIVEGTIISHQDKSHYNVRINNSIIENVPTNNIKKKTIFNSLFYKRIQS